MNEIQDLKKYCQSIKRSDLSRNSDQRQLKYFLPERKIKELKKDRTNLSILISVFRLQFSNDFK